MQNIWLTRRGRRRVIADLNRLLSRYVGHPSDPLEIIVNKMRREVLTYFNSHQDDLKLFVENGSLDYRFNILQKKGIVVGVEFEKI